jgi:hypothetical protein
MKISQRCEMRLSKKFHNDAIAVVHFGGGREITVSDNLSEDEIREQENRLFLEVCKSAQQDLVTLKKDPLWLSIANTLVEAVKKDLNGYE